LADHETARPPPDLIYENTGAMAPLVYFDIVGAYGTMHGAIEVEFATRILVPKPNGATEVKFLRPDGCGAVRTPPPICATRWMPR
jgi:hypothetical protein